MFYEESMILQTFISQASLLARIAGQDDQALHDALLERTQFLDDGDKTEQLAVPQTNLASEYFLVSDQDTSSPLSEHQAGELKLATEIAQDLFHGSKAVVKALGKNWSDSLAVNPIVLADTTWQAGPDEDEQIINWVKQQVQAHPDKQLALVCVTGSANSDSDVKEIAKKAKESSGHPISANPEDYVKDPNAGENIRRVILFGAEFIPIGSGSSQHVLNLRGQAIPDSTLRSEALKTAQTVFGDTLSFSTSSIWPTISFDGDVVPQSVIDQFSMRFKDMLENYHIVPIISLRHPDYQNPQSPALIAAWEKIAAGLTAIKPGRIFPATAFLLLPPDNDKSDVELSCVAFGVERKTDKQSSQERSALTSQPYAGSNSSANSDLSEFTEWGGPFVGPIYIRPSEDKKLAAVAFGAIGPIWGRLAFNAGIGMSTELGSSSMNREISGFYFEAGPSLSLFWNIHAEAGLTVMGLMGPSAYGNYYGFHYYPDGPGLGAFMRFSSLRISGEKGDKNDLPTHSEHGIELGLQWMFGR